MIGQQIEKRKLSSGKTENLLQEVFFFEMDETERGWCSFTVLFLDRCEVLKVLFDKVKLSYQI